MHTLCSCAPFTCTLHSHVPFAIHPALTCTLSIPPDSTLPMFHEMVLFIPSFGSANISWTSDSNSGPHPISTPDPAGLCHIVPLHFAFVLTSYLGCRFL